MPDQPMPDHDVKLGTAADEPTAQPVDPKTDMNRYFYPPGTTEPQLRPEFAEEAAPAEPAAAEEESEGKPLRGPLPDDFPGHAALADAGLTTYTKVRKELAKDKPFDEVAGIGPATADKIRAAMEESSPDEEEQD